MSQHYNEDEHLCESEELLTEAATGGGWFMSFFLGGLFANLFMPRTPPRSTYTLPSNFSLEENPTEMELTEEQKTFLSHVCAIDADIKKSEQDGNWVRLYC